MFKSLYYIVPISNLNGIFKYGKVFSRNKVIENGLIVKDPSDKDVQKRRANKVVYETYKNRFTLHDYVNLYINPRNAMLYRYIKKKEKIAVLEFSGSLLRKFRYVMYSFKNASADDAIISDSPDLIMQNIDKIFSSSWNGNEELKKIMQSEVLVLGYVPTKNFLKKIIVPSKYKDEVKVIVRKFNLNIPVVTHSDKIADIFFKENY